VQARTVAAATGVVGGQVAVAGGALQPGICGDRSTTTAAATIVWHDQGTGIAARTATVDAAGAITLGPVNLVATASDVVSGPAIGKSNVAGGVTVVTWETATTTNSLHARAIGHDAVALGSILPIVLGFAGPLDHAVDGDGQQFVLIHRQGQLYVTRLSWNGAALSLGTASSVPGAFAPRTPAIGWLGDRYLIAWQETTANPFDSDVYVRTYDATCTPCSQRITLPTASGANQRKPMVAPQHAGTGPQQEALVVWDETATTVPFTSNVVAHRFAPMLGAPPVVLGPACGGGGTAGTNGPFALGNQQFRFTLTGGDPQAPLALLSLGIGQPPVVCGCSFTQAITNYAFFVNGGAAEFLFPVPCGTGLLGFQLEFQWLLLGAAASPCPVVPGLVASERVRLTIAE